jgi:hypothetical protein
VPGRSDTVEARRTRPSSGPGRAVLTRPRHVPAAVTRAARHEITVVMLLLVALEAVVLGSYFSGTVTAPWDFLGSYNAEAFAWWHDGSFFSPPQWMPYVWGGYPAAASVQNSAFYLPVGLVSGLVPYTIHAATALQALHVGLGALGMYVLVRRHGLGRAESSLGLVAYFFAVGFFSNAQHVDIVRAFAWAPWVLVCLSPRWAWRSWWGVPAAALILWQAAVSSYPGALVQLLYGAVGWVVAQQLVTHAPLRRYLLPAAAAGGTALLLTVLKYLPFILIRGFEGSGKASTDTFSVGIFNTLFFAYDVDGLPNDLSMRSFFLVAPVVPLALLAAPRVSRLVAPAATLVVTALVIGLPVWPWDGLVDLLPGMGLSRFQMADSRVGLTVGAVALACVGLRRLRTEAPLPRGAVVAVVTVPVVALVLGTAAGLAPEDWSVAWVLLAAVTAVIVAAGRELPAAARGAVGSLTCVALVGLAAVSGTSWAFNESRTWRTPRAEVERLQWGATSGELVLQRAGVTSTDARPARDPLPDPAEIPPLSQFLNYTYYSGALGVGGYVNLAGAQSFEAMQHPLVDPGPIGTDARTFWQAPGIVVQSTDVVPPAAEVQRCVDSGICGAALTAKPTGYAAGSWSYRVDVDAPLTVSFNEAWYPGFRLTACDVAGGTCEDVAVHVGDGGQTVAALVPGTWDLTLQYDTPGDRAGWAAFALGAAVVVLYPAGWGAARLVRRRRAARAERPAHHG